jgi:hypothetical protein
MNWIFIHNSNLAIFAMIHNFLKPHNEPIPLSLILEATDLMAKEIMQAFVFINFNF